LFQEFRRSIVTGQQRLHLAAKLLVVAAGVVEVRPPIAGWLLTRGMKQILDLLPSTGYHEVLP
jgi:hypothetical protein